MYYEIGFPKRKLVRSDSEFVRLVNLLNGKVNLYRTVYEFEKLNEEGYRPDYNSARIDKVFFDFDGEDAYEKVKQLHDWLEERRYYHYVRFSGRGYHLFLLVDRVVGQDKRAFVSSVQLDVLEKSGLGVDGVDRSVLGDLARLARLPNTINLKSGRYCRNLSKVVKPSEVEQNYSRDLWIFGDRYYSYDGKIRNVLPMTALNADFTQVNVDGGILDIPPCIKAVISKKWAGWEERYMIFLWFKENGLSKKDALEFMKEHLTEKREHNRKVKFDWEHAFEDERIADYVWQRDYMWSCKRAKGKGLCPIAGLCEEVKDLYGEF